MSNYFNLPFGVRISNSDPIDKDRYIASNITERDNIISSNRSYEGLQVYVESDKKLYILTGSTSSDWKEVGDGSGGGITMSDGASTRLVTATGTDSVKGETNLTFNGTTLDLTGNLVATIGISGSTLYASTSIKSGSDITLNASTGGITGITMYASTSIRAGSSILLDSSTGGLTGTTMYASTSIRAGSTITLNASTGGFSGSTIYITATGYGGDWVATSDIRIKENIKPIDNALDKILNSRGVYFNFINDKNKEQKIGVIAQELEQIIPQLVLNKNTDDLRSVSYGSLSAILIEAIKEQNNKIKDLEKEIELLKNKN